jgi:rhomboid protease GluP
MPVSLSPRLEKTLLSEAPRRGAGLASLCGLALLLLAFAADQQGLFNDQDLLSATREQVFGRHEYWRAFTAQLLHADLGHLLDNAVFFAGLSYLLYGYFGAWAFPGLSFLAGGLANLATLWLYPERSGIVGASGVVYFMAAFWLTLYFFIQRDLSPWRRGLNALGLSLALLFPELWDERVSYLAHAIGYALGVVAGIGYFSSQKEVIRSRERWREPEPELAEEQDELPGSLGA